jgi:S1-C subfamily serine protease
MKEVPMDWDNENPVVPPTDALAPPEAPANTVTISKTHWRLARTLSALVLVLAIGGAGFILGHDVVTPTPIRAAAPKFNFPTYPSGGYGNGGGSPSFQYPSATPTNTKADAAAAKIAAKVDPGLVDITSTFASQSGTAEGTGMILTKDGLVLTNNHVVEDAQTLTVRDVATNAPTSARSSVTTSPRTSR